MYPPSISIYGEKWQGINIKEMIGVNRRILNPYVEECVNRPGQDPGNEVHKPCDITDKMIFTTVDK